MNLDVGLRLGFAGGFGESKPTRRLTIRLGWNLDVLEHGSVSPQNQARTSLNTATLDRRGKSLQGEIESRLRHARRRLRWGSILWLRPMKTHERETSFPPRNATGSHRCVCLR